MGPVSGTLKGKVKLSDGDPLNGYKIIGEGEGGIAGFTEGRATVQLGDASDAQTASRYDVEANVSGKSVRLGGRFGDGDVRNLANQFAVPSRELSIK